MKEEKNKSLLGEKQIAAVKLRVDNGLTWQEIANIIGVNRVTIWRWFQKKEIEQYYENYELRRIRSEFREIVREEEKKIQALSEKLNSANGWEANAAACAILDRFTKWLTL